MQYNPKKALDVLAGRALSKADGDERLNVLRQMRQLEPDRKERATALLAATRKRALRNSKPS